MLYFFPFLFNIYSFIYSFIYLNTYLLSFPVFSKFHKSSLGEEDHVFSQSHELKNPKSLRSF